VGPTLGAAARDPMVIMIAIGTGFRTLSRRKLKGADHRVNHRDTENTEKTKTISFSSLCSLCLWG
jgi:hypothetical protein